MKPKKIVLEDRTEYRLNGQCHREDGPAIIHKDGTEFWYHHGLRHREDGPAVIYKSGTKAWYLHGEYHREDGPACTWEDGTKEWFIEGTKLTEKEVETAKQILSGEYPFKGLPLLINHPTLKYFALKKLGDHK